MITPFKLPDNKVPIKIGDDSYIYKDVYNPIEWFGGEPYRPRVETLVLKDNGTHVYAHVTKKGYRIPGGSTDKDSTYEKQAENETNEEALIGVKDLKYSGISYSRAMDPNWLKKGGDGALAYVGSLNYVYVANWDGTSIDKSTIEEKDLDDDMAQKGTWQRIEELDLDREHMGALVNSGMLDKRVELVLRHKLDETSYKNTKRLIFENGNDLGPLKKRYIFHGSLHKFDIFHPMSLDLGNNEEKPGWSTFCFDDYEFAKRFAIMRAMQKLTDHRAEKEPVYRVGWDLRNARPYINREVTAEIFTKLQSIPLYIYTIDASKLELGVGNDERYPEYTFRKDNVRYEVREVVYVDRYSVLNDVTLLDSISAKDFEKEQTENLPNLNRGWMARMLNRDYSGDSEVTKLTSAVAKGELKPGDDVEEYMQKHNIVLKNVGYYAHLQENMAQGPTNKEMTIYLGDNRMLMSPTNYKESFNVDEIDEILPRNSQLDNRNIEKYRYYMYLLNNGGNGDIVGYCDVIDMAVAGESDRRYYVVRVFVVPRCRRLGLGDVLANYAIRYIISDLDNGDCNATLVMVDKKVSSISRIDNWIKSKGLLKGVPVEGSYEGNDVVYTRVFSKAFPESIKQYVGDIVEEAADFSKKVPKSLKLYHASPKQNMKYIEPRRESINAIVGQKEAAYTSDDPRFSACFGIEWHDDVARQGSWDNWDTVTFGISDKVDLTKPCSMYEVENDGSFTQIKTKEFITFNKVKVKRETKFNTGMDMLKAYGVDVISLDEYKNRLTMESGSGTKNLKLDNFKKQKLTNSLVDRYKTNDSVLCELEPYNLGDGVIWFDKEEYVAACSVEYKLLDRFNWITAIEVAAPYRGSGLGKQVLDYAVKTLKGNTISVWKKNEIALNLYKKYGFKISKASEEQVKSGGSSMYFMYLPSALSKEDIEEVNNVTMGPVKEGTVFDLTDDNQIEYVEDTFVEESWEDNKFLKPIYIILTYAGTRFGKVITAWQHCKFSHAGLSLNSKMDKVYTFNMRTEIDDNGKKKITGGADIENLDDYHNPAENNDADICVMAMFVTPDIYDMIKKNIEKIFAVADKTKYSISSVISIVINRAVDTKDSMKMICSQFVDYILKQSNIDISNKSSNITTPNDFYKAANRNPNIFLLYDGKKSGYSPKSVDRKIGHLRHSDKYGDINIAKNLVVEAFTVYKDDFQRGKPYKLSSFNKTPISKQTLHKFKQQELCRELLHIDDYDTGYIYTDKDTGKFVAVIAVDKSDDRKYNWITAVEVGKDYQGHGLARQLLDVATKELGGNALSVHFENKVAIETYKKYGFKESKESKEKMRTRIFMYYGNDLANVTERMVSYATNSTTPNSVLPNDIKQLNNMLSTNFKYGAVVKGKIIKDMDNYDFNDYMTLTLSEFEKYRTGVCWDYVHYEANWFKNHGYRYEGYYMQVDDNGGDMPSHTFLVFYLPNSDAAYLFDPLNIRGTIKKFDNIDELLTFTATLHIKYWESVEGRGNIYRNTLVQFKYDPAPVSFERLNVAEYIKLATNGQIVVESARVFLGNESMLYNYKEEMHEEPVIENVIFNKDNTLYNVDKFISGESNVLLVTGLSGSGKSTLAQKYAKDYNAEWIELDVFEHCYGFETDEQLKQAGEVFYEYLSNHSALWGKLKGREITGKELGVEIAKFVRYCVKWSAQHHDKKWVIEGVQIYSMLSADEVKKYPLIIMGTSAKNSILQRFKRNAGGGDIEWGKELKDQFPNLLAWYWDEEKTLKGFEKEVKKVMESLNLLLEADGDEEDEDEATDYTSEVDGEETDASDADATSDGEQANDYTDDTETDGANDYTSDATGGEDGGEDTSSEVDGSAGTDEEPTDDDGGGDVDAGEAEGDDMGATDYTNMDGDSGSDDTSSDDSSSYDDSTAETDNQTINNRIKNYSILKDFERLYRLANEIGEALDPVIMEKPIQNKVVTQVKENILAIKEAIMWFVQYGASAKYSYNLYYYEIFMSALKINVQILEKNKKFSEELKNKMKPKK